MNQVFKIRHYLLGESLPGTDLDYEGSFNWIDVGVSKTLNGSFNVKNIGDNGSLLNWSIEPFPSWGNWSFNPESGENLAPEDGPFMVEVEIVAPEKKRDNLVNWLMNF